MEENPLLEEMTQEIERDEQLASETPDIGMDDVKAPVGQRR